MKKKLILPFESARERYKAEATVVWCYDNRFSLALQVFAEKMGWRNYDLIKVAGGVYELGTAGDINGGADFLLRQIEKSVKVNHSPEIFLMAHYNCVSFGREQMEPSDEEDQFFAAELRHGKERVESYLDSVGAKANVRLLLVDFKNVYEVEA